MLCRWGVGRGLVPGSGGLGWYYMADIENPDMFVSGCQIGICLDITSFYEEQRQPSSGSTWPACKKNGKSGTHRWGQEVSTQFAQQFVTGVTAPPLVACVVWSLHVY